MGNYNNVMLGQISSLEINGSDVGFIYGNVKVTKTAEVKDFETGCPKTLQGSRTMKEIFEVEFPCAEMTATNLGHILGLTPTTVAAAEVNKTASFTAYTASKTFGCGTLYVSKIGPDADPATNVTISGGADVPVIKNVAEAVTYTEGDDYIVDYATGRVYWNPDGTHYTANLVADSYVAHYKYKYTPAAYDRFDFGLLGALPTFSCKFTYEDPSTSKSYEGYMHKAQASPSVEWTFTDAEYLVSNFKISAVSDSTHATNPLGYLKVV